MKFDKKNHHYVPQYWQRGFKGTSGHMFGKLGSTIRLVSSRTIMKQDWLYTVFDEQWNPSDMLEDTLSVLESKDAQLFQRLQFPGYTMTSSDRDQLCSALALQASRHPDILERGRRLANEFGTILADVHSMTLIEFKRRVAEFGINEADAHDFHVLLTSRTQEQLASELVDLHSLSPQSSQLPVQIAILAAPQIMETIKALELSLLDAPSGEAFVLGDTPLPQSDLSNGFTVPLSKSLAVIAIPSTVTQKTVVRRDATPAEVKDINNTQASNALQVIIGPSADLLSKL
ncbi:DUF4238 domain-containing protein [Salmonella enterica]|uniref:DUF4238 domain-containing protein n=1 Tax=Citrobacter freundii TaxID=546 RepID=UPI001B37C5DE|nr:DUF4238 domain-containing protein [Citrobacter freundii]EHO4421618.1 DUF4238 domain-containing protein [Salmonella enterica]HDX8776039.1 DUF4238 domain-containing protein [Klebsiella oxytoca]EIL1869114.1 DUF4238 domain-containing protein [Salmonella enterica]EKU4665048.1 DUF4238 domain-containing protein [Citrobacter freundii]ELH4154195.1 DUF4238 domain-containing protein [Salmonella enterica]